MGILHAIKLRLANRTVEGRIKYLRGQGCQIGERTRVLCDIGCFGTEPYLIEIGKDCLLSSNLSFFTHDGGVKVLNSLGYFGTEKMDKVGRITVGNNCFIGHGAKIMQGVTIGDNVVVGTGSIVTKDIPSNSVAVGVPAKVICSIDEFYHKNKEKFVPTCGMPTGQKKKYILENLK